MKYYLRLLTVIGLLLGGNTMAETHEFVVFKFNDGIAKGEQEKLMAQLNSCVQKYDGLISRSYYYSEKDNRWIDHVTWTSSQAATKASAAIMKDPNAGTVFKNIDEKSMIFSHYDKKN